MMFFVYILASQPQGTLYVGVTSHLVQRIWEHKCKAVPGFTAKYGVDRLVWFEPHQDWESAIRREKQIQGVETRVEDPTDRSRQSTVD